LHGKPGLLNLALGAREVHFNLSHSNGRRPIAAATEVPVGIDIKRVTSLDGIDHLIPSVLSPAEAAGVLGEKLSWDDKLRVFVLSWTSKEAYVKALGDGRSTPLNGLSVLVNSGGPARFLTLGAGDPTAWSLINWELEGGYVAALAARRPELAVSVQAWEPRLATKFFHLASRCASTRTALESP
jgi:4'-phosphopantetheinyl transferase